MEFRVTIEGPWFYRDLNRVFVTRNKTYTKRQNDFRDLKVISCLMNNIIDYQKARADI